MLTGVLDANLQQNVPAAFFAKAPMLTVKSHLEVVDPEGLEIISATYPVDAVR